MTVKEQNCVLPKKTERNPKYQVPENMILLRKSGLYRDSQVKISREGGSNA